MSLYRTIITALVVSFTALTAPVFSQTFDPTLMSESDRKAFHAEIRAYLLEHPEVIFEAVDIYRAREEDEKNRAAKNALSEMADQLANDGMSYIGGNLEGDVTIVEFVDYRCGYCRKAHDELAELIKEDGNVRWVVKEFPILGEASDLSSRLALATLVTLGDEAYLAMHNELMTFNGPINTNSVAAIAKNLNLDGAAIMRGMENPAIDAHWTLIQEQANELAITGTPAFVIGLDLARGYISPRDMRMAVANARESNN
jgi:protein-disulfide isomerase